MHILVTKPSVGALLSEVGLLADSQARTGQQAAISRCSIHMGHRQCRALVTERIPCEHPVCGGHVLSGQVAARSDGVGPCSSPRAKQTFIRHLHLAAFYVPEYAQLSGYTWGRYNLVEDLISIGGGKEPIDHWSAEAAHKMQLRSVFRTHQERR